jgi:hypothetical protein
MTMRFGTKRPYDSRYGSHGCLEWKQMIPGISRRLGDYNLVCRALHPAQLQQWTGAVRGLTAFTVGDSMIA